MGVPDVNHQSGWKIKALNVLAPQRNGHSDAAPSRDDLEKVIRGCAVRVHSGLVHRSKQQLYPITSSARLSASGPHAYCFWSSSRNLCLVGRYIFFLALVGLLVGVKLHSVLGLRRHSMKRASYVRSNREMRPLTEA
jgi:hypothetical protein